MNRANGCTFVCGIRRHDPIAFLAVLVLAALPDSVSANYYRLWQGQAFAAGSGIGYPPRGYGDTENYSLTLFAQFSKPYSHDLLAKNTSADGSGSAYLQGTIQAGVMDAS